MIVRPLVRFFSNRALAQEAHKVRTELAELQASIEEKERILSESRQQYDKEFQLKAASLTKILEDDQDFYNELHPLMVRYLDVYVPTQYLRMERQNLGQHLSELIQRRDELTDWINSISADLEQLQRARAMLSDTAGVHAHAALVQQQVEDFPRLIGHPRDFHHLAAYRKSYPQDSYEHVALTALERLIEHKSRFRGQLEQVNWAIRSLKTMRRQLRRGRRQAQENIHRLAPRHQAVSSELKSANEALVKIGARIHRLWNDPIDKLDERIERTQVALNDTRSWLEYYKRKVRECHDYEQYDDLEKYKSRRGSAVREMQSLWEKGRRLRAERRVWYERRHLVFQQLKSNELFLLGGPTRS